MKWTVPIYLFFLVGLFVQCKSIRISDQSFGGSFEIQETLTNPNKWSPTETSGLVNLPRDMVILHSIAPQDEITHFMEKRKVWMPEKLNIQELKGSVRKIRKIAADSPARTHDGKQVLGLLFLGLILLLFFYLFFLLFTKLGFVSMPFWKAALYFAAVVIFLMIFMTY